jgi:hypothetical protein
MSEKSFVLEVVGSNITVNGIPLKLINVIDHPETQNSFLSFWMFFL